MLLFCKTFEFNVMAAVGFVPTPPKRLVPKTSALDRSATLPLLTLQCCDPYKAVRLEFQKA